MKAIILALLLVSFVAACDIPQSFFDKITGVHLDGPARAVIGNNKVVELLISDTNQTYFYAVNDWIANNTNQTTADLVVTTDSCTIEGIDQGTIDPLEAYKEGNIHVQAASVGSKVRVGVAKMVLAFASWFS